MKPWTREHAYYMAKLYDYHIAYEFARNPDNDKRIATLYKQYERYTELHNSFPKTKK